MFGLDEPVADGNESHCLDCGDDPANGCPSGYCDSCGRGECRRCDGTGIVEQTYGDIGREYACPDCASDHIHEEDVDRDDGGYRLSFDDDQHHIESEAA